jgi:hypothetical protein
MRPSHWCTVILGCVLALLLQIPSPAAQSSGRTVADGAGSRTLVAIGDSLGNGLWEGLHIINRRDKTLSVENAAEHSVGFTNSDMFAQIDRAFSREKVDALVIMIGANDDRRSFFEGGKSVALFGTDKWIELYRARVGRFMDRASKRNVPIVWVLLPIMRDDEASHAAMLFNEIVTKEAKERPLIALVPTWKLTATADDRYMAHFKDGSGKMQLMRHSDGLHFTRAGYQVVADLVMKRLGEVSPKFAADRVDAKTGGKR